MNIYKFHEIQKKLLKDNIVCLLVPLINVSKNGTPAINEDEIHDTIEASMKNKFLSPSTFTIGTSLDYVLDTILLEYNSIIQLKLTQRTLVFYKFIKNNQWISFDSPSTFKINDDSLHNDFEEIGSVRFSMELFAPLANGHRRFFNYWESSMIPNSRSSFHNWTLNQQLKTLLNEFSNDSESCSIALLSLICKTNIGCYSFFLIENQKTSYCLYKIQNNVLILFGLKGSDDFIKKSLIEIHTKMNEQKVINIIYRTKTELYSKQLKSWPKIPIIELNEVGWEFRSYLGFTQKEMIQMTENMRAIQKK
jgi:hypothetical protein